MSYERCGWLATLGGTYFGDSFSDEANTVGENPDGNLGLNEARTVWDTQVEKTFLAHKGSRISVALGATNLFDRFYAPHLSYQRDPFRTGARVYDPGRNIYVNLSFRF